MEQDREITREELHQLVWSKPTRTMAKEFGLSDSIAAAGVRYSFSGKIQGPHTALDAGYVSFGNPVDNNWYQIAVDAGQTQVRDLGVLNATKGKSLRELVDRYVRKKLKSKYYRTKSPASKPPSRASRLGASSVARAKSLRGLIEKAEVGRKRRDRNRGRGALVLVRKSRAETWTELKFGPAGVRPYGTRPIRGTAGKATLAADAASILMGAASAGINLRSPGP